MQYDWHYSRDGKRHGPITATQLKELATTGRLSPDDLVWRRDMKEWRNASTVKGLFPKNAGRTSATSPPPLPQTVSSSDEAQGATPKKFLWGCLLFPVMIALLLSRVQRARDVELKAPAERQQKAATSSMSLDEKESEKNGGPLTEAYFPYKPGSQRIMMGAANVGDKTWITKDEYTDSGDGLITKRRLKWTAMKGDQIVHFPIVASDPEVRRVHNGFVEVKSSTWIGNDDSGWDPFIKLGAVVGDSWPGLMEGAVFTFVGFKDRILKDATVRCAVIEEIQGDPFNLKIVRLYAIDLGMVSERAYDIADGKEVYLRTLFLEGLRSDESDK
jgi:hypothetical protein